MEIIARTKFNRTSARKLRLIAEAAKTIVSPTRALVYLASVRKNGADPIYKTLKQAVSNATNNFSLVEKNLKLKNIKIDDGPIIKRFQPVSRGTAHPIMKRTSHITVILESPEKKVKDVVKSAKAEEKKEDKKK